MASQGEYDFPSALSSVGIPRSCLKILSHATVNTNQEDRKKSRCHGNNARHADIALVVTGISFTMTGELKNSRFSFFTSQPLYMNPTSSSLSHIHISALTHCTHLTHTCLCPVFLGFFFSQRNPNANFQNLAVQRQLPPGVLVSQKALQKEWKISFMKFFSLQKLKKCIQIWECCQSLTFPYLRLFIF